MAFLKLHKIVLFNRFPRIFGISLNYFPMIALFPTDFCQKFNLCHFLTPLESMWLTDLLGNTSDLREH